MKQKATTATLAAIVVVAVLGLAGTDIGRYALAMIIGSFQAITQ